MPSTYIPRRDSELNAWLRTFATNINADPASFGLTPLDAAEVAAAVGAWQAAYTTAVAPDSRTKVAVLVKDEQRKAVLKVVRAMAAKVRANPAIDGAARIALGLHVRPTGEGKQSGAGSRIPAPTSQPRIVTMGIAVGRQFIRIQDMERFDRRGKPPGTIGALLFRAVADGPVERPEGAELVGMITSNTYTSEFRLTDHGKTATYFARWVGPKGETGPWSFPTSMPIAA